MRIQTMMLATALAAFSGSILAKNEWTSVQGNPAHTGYLAVTTTPEKMRVLWTRKLAIDSRKDGDPELSFDWFHGVVISGHTVFVSMEYYYSGARKAPNMGGLTAINADNGQILWQNSGDKEFTLLAINGDEIYSGLVNAGNSASLVSYDEVTGKLQHSMLLSGWTMRTLNNGPIAFNGMLYAASSTMLESFDGATGKYNWSVPAGDFIPMAAVSDKYFIRAINKGMGGIEGLNKVTGESEFSILAPNTNVYVSTIHYPVIDEVNNLAFYSFYMDNVLYAFDLKDHTVKWSMPDISGQPILAGDELYVMDGKKLLAINPVDGSINWQWRAENERYKHHEYYPVATADLVIVSVAQMTYAISRKTHQVVWQVDKEGWLALGDNLLVILEDVHNKDNNNSFTQAIGVALN